MAQYPGGIYALSGFSVLILWMRRDFHEIPFTTLNNEYMTNQNVLSDGCVISFHIKYQVRLCIYGMISIKLT